MNTSIIPYLVKRFLRFDKDQPFIFLSALLAFLGITLGVMVLIIAMALMNGFDKEFKNKLTVMNYPLTILPKFDGSVNEELLTTLAHKFPNLDFSPFVMSSVMTRSGSTLEGGYIFGVDFKADGKLFLGLDHPIFLSLQKLHIKDSSMEINGSFDLSSGFIPIAADLAFSLKDTSNFACFLPLGIELQ